MASAAVLENSVPVPLEPAGYVEARTWTEAPNTLDDPSHPILYYAVDQDVSTLHVTIDRTQSAVTLTW